MRRSRDSTTAPGPSTAPPRNGSGSASAPSVTYICLPAERQAEAEAFGAAVDAAREKL